LPRADLTVTCAVFTAGFGKDEDGWHDNNDKGWKIFRYRQRLTTPERHILGKLFIWELFASIVDQLREKEKEAMFRGWNNSGPIKPSKQ
jgi:hypothetical protein